MERYREADDEVGQNVAVGANGLLRLCSAGVQRDLVRANPACM